ncbi:Rieske [2Fe-2S] domain-containing protein [Mariprofundus ferrinatatus]|uniref:Rieske [2Fe-2S] domain-containing protein n=1 Tax=Mariprofundus ferrinatatus TaxID=1921087 RepID=A0A2K8L6X3_9PROT|nr:Rieske 2Fe-2S domain-containing protein [Mariprofundus ferrinatatus]ATX82862.1 Rieske [2Fe-2S] domain-containing protein [Mariprofundus ferrinatatus]
MSKQQDWQFVNKPAEGEAVCFDLKATIHLSDGSDVDISEQGFLICFQGQYRAWRNHCPHAGAPLDWEPGRFFSDDGGQLLCHVHFAHFDPLSGECLSGPCSRGLYPLEFREMETVIQVPSMISNPESGEEKCHG